MCLVIDKVIYSCLLSDRPTCSTSLTGLSVLLRNAIVIIFSRGDLQPSGIRRFGNGVSQLSPLRPVLGNGDPLIEILRNALTSERVLQRPAPIHLWVLARGFINTQLNAIYQCFSVMLEY